MCRLESSSYWHQISRLTLRVIRRFSNGHFLAAISKMNVIHQHIAMDTSAVIYFNLPYNGCFMLGNHQFVGIQARIQAVKFTDGHYQAAHLPNII